MTDNEIVKALECCIETSGVNCGKCPYYNNCITDENTSLMMTDTLDLINRQQADIEKNENIIRLADKTIETANAEIERLKTNLNIELENYATEYDNKIKSEAYREFAERLRKKSKLKTVGHGEVASMFDEYEIDNLLKELVGEDDG